MFPNSQSMVYSITHILMYVCHEFPHIRICIDENHSIISQVLLDEYPVSSIQIILYHMANNEMYVYL